MTRHSGAFIAFLLLTSAQALAQEAAPPQAAAPAPHQGCALHPSPDCGLFGVTDFGFAFGPTRRDTTHYPGRRRTTARTTLEGGVMYNLGPRDAIGITAFFTVGDEDVSLGTGARYRRWLTRRQSIDVGLAVPLGSSDYEGGTVLGLLRYSPTPWLGLSVRPERLRGSVWVCTQQRCAPVRDDTARVMVGGDLTGKPGAIGLTSYGAAVGVLLLLFALSSPH